MTAWSAEVAEWYAAAYGEYATNRLALDAVDVAPDAVVVDVGCGTGYALRRLAPRVSRGRLVGVDPTPQMLAIARERAADDPNGHRIEFVEAPAERLPLDDDAADLVLAFDAIDHWDDAGTGLSEIARILRPGGRLIVVKDGGVPGGSRARREFVATLDRARLAVLRRAELREGDISCAVWFCGHA
jgi:ubiquinone/menaquinone biosynthesis C-methylase UbiE